jgi:hypothetical protein
MGSALRPAAVHTDCRPGAVPAVQSPVVRQEVRRTQAVRRAAGQSQAARPGARQSQAVRPGVGQSQAAHPAVVDRRDLHPVAVRNPAVRPEARRTPAVRPVVADQTQAVRPSAHRNPAARPEARRIPAVRRVAVRIPAARPAVVHTGCRPLVRAYQDAAAVQRPVVVHHHRDAVLAGSPVRRSRTSSLPVPHPEALPLASAASVGRTSRTRARSSARPRRSTGTV